MRPLILVSISQRAEYRGLPIPLGAGTATVATCHCVQWRLINPTTQVAFPNPFGSCTARCRVVRFEVAAEGAPKQKRACAGLQARQDCLNPASAGGLNSRTYFPKFSLVSKAVEQVVRLGNPNTKAQDDWHRFGQFFRKGQLAVRFPSRTARLPPGGRRHPIREPSQVGKNRNNASGVTERI